MDDKQPFIKVFESTPEVKDTKRVSNSLNLTTNLKEIERMALKLGSFFDSFDEWVKLGMIIHYETNKCDECLELFDKLSQTFDKYDGVIAVSKQYYTCKYTKSIADKIDNLYKWFYDTFPEEK
jgi:hypothetical protein